MSNLLRVGLCSACDCEAPPVTGAPQKSADSTFTYDEGKGVKETIVMDGPLSQVYAKALNLYFAKQPVTVEVQDSLSAAFESAAIDAVLTNSIVTSNELDEENKNTMGGFNIVPANMDIVESPTAVIYSMTARKDVIDSNFDMVDATSEKIKKSGKDFIVFIGPEFGINGNAIQKEMWLDYADIGKLNSISISEKFQRSTEEFFEARGIQVAVGFESLINWLKTRSKG